MKILHAAETYRGGIATVVNQLIEDQLSRDGCKVALVLPEDHISDVSTNNSLLRFPYKRKRRGILALLSFTRRFYEVFHAIEPDVVHLHSTFAGVCCRIVLLPQILGRKVRVIYCPHGWSFLMQCGSNSRRLRIWVERLLAKFSDRIVCISDHEFEEAAEVGLPKSRLSVVKNAIPYRKLAAANDYSAGSESPDKNSDTLKLLFVGRFDEQKGFDLLVAALEQLRGRSIHLVAVGSSVVGSAQFNESENIQFTGWLRPEQLENYYASADLLVMPSRWEGFGLTALEAMSFGTPVLASRVGGLKEIVRPGVNGELCDPSIKDIARILDQTPLSHWRSLRDGARSTAIHDFSSRRMTEAVFGLYRTVLKS